MWPGEGIVICSYWFGNCKFPWDIVEIWETSIDFQLKRKRGKQKREKGVNRMRSFWSQDL